MIVKYGIVEYGSSWLPPRVIAVEMGEKNEKIISLRQYLPHAVRAEKRGE